MRVSQWFLVTQKETPNDAEIASHQLMMRTGMIRKLGSGLYTWMPLGLKVLRKVEKIVREEMNKAKALELLMPAVQPEELWHETGRWETFGGQLLKMTDSNERNYCFGPTHEEVITDIMRNELKSYKQLPINVYQIQTKFRDEIRPRFGVMRAREFLMKDAYSFHVSKECLAETYQAMYDAYHAIFARLGLKFRAVEADTGAIGGYASHEFQVLADAGEDLVFFSDESSYAANVEQAVSLRPEKAIPKAATAKQLVDTPNKKTIQEVAEFLHIHPNQTVKTLLVKGKEHDMVALVLNGDDMLNEVKAIKHPLVHSPLIYIDEAEVVKKLKVEVGYLGPIGLSIPIIADHHALAMSDFVCGANEVHKHYQQAQWDTDVPHYEGFELRQVKEGDKSPDGKGVLHSCRGIEVGHVFMLGDKYAEAMGAKVLDEQGKLKTMQMGCYGLGISRVVAAAIEQHYDEKGIVWPSAIAPFTVVIIPLNAHKSEVVRQKANALYEELLSRGIDVLIDDRNERAGVMFADHELIGIPNHVIVSDRTLEQGAVEYKSRATGLSEQIELSKVCSFISEQLS